MRVPRPTILAGLFAAMVARAGGEDPGPFGLDVKSHRLPNGMTLLYVERHDVPTVATYLQFNVGGVDDPKGQTGIAHLLEHMMFKGTESFGTTGVEAEKPLMEKLDQLWAELDRERERARSPFHKAEQARVRELETAIEKVTAEQKKHIIKNELWQAYQRVGGTGLNASTGDDSTQYYVQLPGNQLRVWAYLESDRLAHPVFREFYSERDVVHEERRLRTDTQPQGLFGEAFGSAAFIAHPYRNPVVGWSSDIDSTVRAEVLEHFRTYYAPNNCVAALVGDLNPSETIALIEQTFGKIPAKPAPRRNVTEEPEHKGERRFTMNLDAAPEIQIGYPMPAAGNADSFPLVVAARVLTGTRGAGGPGGGRSGRGGGSGTGRLFRKLVLEKKIAIRASASARPGKYPGLFTVSATPSQGASLADLEKALTDEIERLKSEPPTDDELARVRNTEDAEFVRRLRTNEGIAAAIARAQTLAGDWRYLLEERESIKKATAEDVARVVKQYLVRERRTVGSLEDSGRGSSGRREVER